MITIDLIQNQEYDSRDEETGKIHTPESVRNPVHPSQVATQVRLQVITIEGEIVDI